MSRTILARASLTSAFYLSVSAAACAQEAGHVLIVVNGQSSISQRIGAYYRTHRSIATRNVCRLDVTDSEEIPRTLYVQAVEQPIAKCLSQRDLTEQVLYIVTTLGVPLKISGSGGQLTTTAAAVDSELAALYPRLHGTIIPWDGPRPNPYFNSAAKPFRHPDFPIYMVTRLAGFDYADTVGLIDRASHPLNAGKVVIDLRGDDSTPGNTWLRAAAEAVPKERLVFDDTARVLYNQSDVIAYASWGSNDPDRHRRTLGFRWLSGAIMTDFVSTNARTFQRPPATWTIGTWKNPAEWFAGAPQNLCADEIREGVTGIAGHVYEPLLAFNPRPDLLIPAYLAGKPLAESFYSSIPAISWQNVVVGDPLCRLHPVGSR